MSNSKNKIGFSLNNVTTEQFAIIEEAFNIKNPVELNLGSSFAVDIDKKLISNFFKVQFIQEKTPFLILETGCHFKISPDAWQEFFDKEKNKIKLPQRFAGHLLMLNIGTSRGVLHAKTDDTVYNQFMLPTINVNRLIDTDVIMDLTEENAEG
ncbi:MAG: hypothetical protein R3353_01020 [Salegentibacter mishustinae]|nr:hypothetical protein [Salegentibacter mishustinae]